MSFPAFQIEGSGLVVADEMLFSAAGINTILCQSDAGGSDAH
jgi:hypothetical protein